MPDTHLQSWSSEVSISRTNSIGHQPAVAKPRQQGRPSAVEQYRSHQKLCAHLTEFPSSATVNPSVEHQQLNGPPKLQMLSYVCT